MPDEVEECVHSVLTDNPDYSKSKAYAICYAKNNRDELGLGFDATHDELIQALAKESSDCPDGQVRAGDGCVPVHEITDAPPSVVGTGAVFALADIDTEPIERIEEAENQIRYTNIKLISPGVWTDSASRETVWYSPEGIKNLEIDPENTVNIMHDADNDVSAAGELDPDSVTHTDEGVFADVVIDTSSAAGQYADENLQKTLETEGAKGFGGPSVEISAEGQEVEFNAAKGMKELVGGIIDGLGFVKNPASKPVSFARQVAQRGVALADGEASVMERDTERGDMDADNRQRILEAIATRELQMDAIQDDAQAIADELEVPIDEVLEVLDPLMDMGEGEEEEDTEAADDEDDQPGGDEEDAGDGEEDDEEEEEDLAERVEALDERLTNLEDMAEQAMAAEDVEEQLEELADAETVADLAEAKEDLEKRLSELEERPDTPKALADGEGEDEPAGTITEMGEYNERTRTYRR